MNSWALFPVASSSRRARSAKPRPRSGRTDRAPPGAAGHPSGGSRAAATRRTRAGHERGGRRREFGPTARSPPDRAHRPSPSLTVGANEARCQRPVGAGRLCPLGQPVHRGGGDVAPLAPRGRLDQFDHRPRHESQVVVLIGRPGAVQRGLVLAEAVVQERDGVLAPRQGSIARRGRRVRNAEVERGHHRASTPPPGGEDLRVHDGGTAGRLRSASASSTRPTPDDAPASMADGVGELRRTPGISRRRRCSGADGSNHGARRAGASIWP